MIFWIRAVPDPDLEICGEGGGGGHPNSEIRGGPPVSPKNFFRPIGPQFGIKIKGGGGRRPGPSPGSAAEVVAYGGWWHLEIRLYCFFFLTLICILCLFAWF